MKSTHQFQNELSSQKKLILRMNGGNRLPLLGHFIRYLGPFLSIHPENPNCGWESLFSFLWNHLPDSGIINLHTCPLSTEWKPNMNSTNRQQWNCETISANERSETNLCSDSLRHPITIIVPLFKTQLFSIHPFKCVDYQLFPNFLRE